MADIAEFLAASSIFQNVPREQIEEIAPLFRSARYPAGSIILRQGSYSQALYFLCSGRVAARIQRGDCRETVANLQPPDNFGELSFITGRACVCDVEVIVDAEVLLLPKEALAGLPRQREAILRALLQVIAGRLQETVIRGAKAEEFPVVLLRNHANWEAPRSFAAELTRSLARLSKRETLLVNFEAAEEQPVHTLDEHASACNLPARAGDADFRPWFAQRLTDWKRSFKDIVLNFVGANALLLGETAKEFANWQGDLLGPGDPVPSEAGAARFVVQSAVRPTLPVLSGSRQLIFEAGQSEAAFRSGGLTSARFRRTVDSIARCIEGLQVGLALGGGAAWGWAHVGVLSVFEQAGLPIDMIAGSSMGSIIGGLYCSGLTTTQLKEIADYWRTRSLRFIEWRLWRMALVSENKVRKVLRQYFGDRLVNQTEIPYWTNAVDVKTGKEFTAQSGSLVDCVRSSICLPGLISPVERDSHLLVDAAFLDPVPVRLVLRMGSHFTIGINSMAALESQQISRRYPFNVLDVMTRCMFLMAHEIGQGRAEQSADIVFTPALGDIRLLEFSRSSEIIECGRKAAELHLPGILASYERLKAGSSASESLPILQQ